MKTSIQEQWDLFLKGTLTDTFVDSRQLEEYKAIFHIGFMQGTLVASRANSKKELMDNMIIFQKEGEDFINQCTEIYPD